MDKFIWFSEMLLSFVTTLCSPNEDFGRRNKRWNPDFRSTFQGCEYSIWATNPRKVSRKSGFYLLFILPKSSFGRDKLYGPQTKILEVWTKRCVCVFEVLFKGVSTRFGLPLIENSFKNAYATLCSAVQNLRLESIKLGYVHNWWSSRTLDYENKFMAPKRRFWKEEQKM